MFTSFQGILVMLLLLSCVSCKKDLPAPGDTRPGDGQDRSVTFWSETHDPRDTSLTLTVLGDPKASNPYHVDTMTRAYNLIYGDNAAQLPITHKYVKFSPGTVEEVARLAESGLTLLYFPMHYEIVEMGDYYLPHGAAPTTIPEFYTVVEADEVLPEVPHVVLDELVLAPYLSVLTYVAFRLSGEEHEGLPGIGTPEVYTGGDGPCAEGLCPDFLCCRFEGIGCEDEDVPEYCFSVTEDCNPWIIGTEAWPDCIEIKDEGDDPDPPMAGGCSCDSWPTRHPAGCIRVEDTELPDNDFVDGQNRHMEGVNNVKVVWWNGWWGLRSTWTDENGCWHIDRREKGKAYMWVVFANDLLHVRSGVGTTWNYHYLFFPVNSYIGQFGGGTYNNIEVNFTMWEVQRSKAHRRWGAAHVMNALPDYRDRAAQDNINLPPANLDIMLNMMDEFPVDIIGDGTIGGDGIPDFVIDLDSNAPMFDHLGLNQVSNIISAGFLDLGWGNVIGEAFEQQWEDMLWDMFINVNRTNSDRLYATLYHEFSHASHFTQVGSAFWTDFIIFEVINGGWGEAGDPGSAVISLCESWSSHMGWTYAHDRYGATNSIGVIAPTWLDRLENTKNDRLDHIPTGVYHDLIDATIDMGNICDDDGGDCQPVTDNVNGFTNADIFSQLTSLTNTVDEFEVEVLSITAGTGNTPQEINDLFDSY